jgi:hypothetical protein
VGVGMQMDEIFTHTVRLSRTHASVASMRLRDDIGAVYPVR